MVHSTKALTPEQKAEKVIAKKNAEIYGESKEAPVQPRIRKATRNVRQSRGVFNGTRGKLKVPDNLVKAFAEAGWHLHIFNDSDGRVEYALQTGYEYVLKEEIGDNLAENVVPSNTALDNKVRFRVGTLADGNGQFAYLMKISTADYEEDQKEIQARNDKVDRAIRSGKNVKPGDSSDGFYDAGTSLKVNTGA